MLETAAPTEIFASCASGLEPFVAGELSAFGCLPNTEPGGVTAQVPVAQLPALVRHLRCASRLLVRVGAGRAESPAELTTLLDRLPWRWWPHVQRLALRLSAHGARPARVGWLQAELLRQLSARVAEVTTQAPDGRRGELALAARLEGARLTLSADVGGAALHERGWRLEPGVAPLRETLAAAVLRAAGWTGAGVLWDPTCGSGTLAIEAALWGSPPLRRFACDEWQWPGVAPPVSGAEPMPTLPRAPLYAGDIDADALDRARRNAERAGVDDRITFLHAEWAQQPVGGAQDGCVVCNPPWGLRLGGRNAARRAVERLSTVVRRRCGGWRLAAVLPERPLAALLPVRAPQIAAVDAGGTTVWLAWGRVEVTR
jgi:putative N6-adenine-specific DNA methylase